MHTGIHRIAVAVVLLACVDAQADVFKCTDAEGSLIYQQTPCAIPEPAEKETEELPAQVTNVETAELVEEVQSSETSEPKSTELVAQCKKKNRDAIDAIDAEMRRGYTPAEGESYRQRLRVLTEQLRGC